MNDDDYGSDSTLTRELLDGLSAVAAPERPPLAAITSRGRTHQRRRRAGFAGLGAAGAAAGTVLALGLTGILGAAPAHRTSPTETAAPARGTGTIRTADFTLTSNANGTASLFFFGLTPGRDAAALQQALAQDGIPALVKTDTYCSSNPPAPSPVGTLGHPHVVFAYHVPGGTPGSLPPAVSDTVPVGTEMLLDPARMPSGTELFLSYFNRENVLYFDLIYTSSYTCHS
jgi:hypothetical protein